MNESPFKNLDKELSGKYVHYRIVDIVNMTPPNEDRVEMTLKRTDENKEYALHIYMSVPVATIDALKEKRVIDIPEELAIALNRCIIPHGIVVNQKQ